MRWFPAIKACGFRIGSCRKTQSARRAVCGGSAYGRATAWECGPATASSGFTCRLATALTGSVLVNVNPAYRAHELRYVLRKSGMKAIFLHERDARVRVSGHPQ